MSALLILLRERPGRPAAPETLPLGRAALRLEAEGQPVLLGATIRTGVATGLRAQPGGWTQATLPVIALHDRFPGWSWPDPWEAALGQAAGLPIGNPRWLTELCRDKLACQRALEDAGLPCPPVEADPGRFAERLAEWGHAFLKPRHGSLGRGVRFVRPGDPLPAQGPGAGTRSRDANVLQSAVLSAPPMALRVVLQRDVAGWIALSPVARCADDPVVNVERGADARLAREVLAPQALEACLSLAHRACLALLAHGDATFALELGFDLVLDGDGRPWIIEVNPAPRGRLRALAKGSAQLREEHDAACLRPLRRLLATARG